MNHQAWNSGDGMTTSRWSMILRGAVAAIVFVASAPSVRAEVIGLDLTTNNPGSITLSGGDNTFTFDSFSIDYLIVAGGGGGAGARNSSPGGRGGGGGGAGGLLQGTGFAISGDQTITVGTGGTGGAGPTVGGFGGNSTAFGFTAIGGGGGGNNVVGTSATDGGSGGGAPSSTNVAANGGLGTPGQGNNGGPGNGSGIAGGGGGAGGAGVLLTGGAGVSSSITGSAVTYAAGGNGGTTASLDTVSVGAAAASTGNGGRGAAPGGANSTVTNAISGGTGGTGIVVVRYTGPQVLTAVRSRPSAVTRCTSFYPPGLPRSTSTAPRLMATSMARAAWCGTRPAFSPSAVQTPTWALRRSIAARSLSPARSAARAT